MLAGATVALGVTAILFSQAYIDGLQVLIRQFVIEARNGAMQVERRGYAESQDLAPLDLDVPADATFEARLRAVPGVQELAPRIHFVGFVSNGDSSTLFSGVAIDPERERRVCPRGPGAPPISSPNGLGLYGGPGFRTGDEQSVIVASELAKAMKVKAGQTLTLLVETRSGSMDAIDVTVVGFYNFTDPMENKHTLVVPIQVAQRVLHMQGRAISYAISVVDQGAIPAVADRMREALKGTVPPLEVQTWADLSPYYRDVITLQNDVLRVVIGIVFILVIAGVVNTMLMSVFERTREIGTLMAMGFRRKKILTMFLFESLLLCAFAAVVGAGVGIALIAYTHQRGVPFYIPAVGEILNRPTLEPRYILVACVGASLAGIAGGMFPAYRASRMKPIEALRST